MILVSFFIGLLPFLDNFAHIGGFVIGIVTSVICVPSITFGKWGARRKKIMVCIAIPVYLVMMGGLFFVFYDGLDASNCVVCQAFDCVPLVPGWCDTPTS